MLDGRAGWCMPMVLVSFMSAVVFMILMFGAIGVHRAGTHSDRSERNDTTLASGFEAGNHKCFSWKYDAYPNRKAWTTQSRPASIRRWKCPGKARLTACWGDDTWM